MRSRPRRRTVPPWSRNTDSQERRSRQLPARFPGPLCRHSHGARTRPGQTAGWPRGWPPRFAAAWVDRRAVVASRPCIHLWTYVNDKYTFVYMTHRSEEHTSELQSHLNLVCRLLLEKKKKKH